MNEHGYRNVVRQVRHERGRRGRQFGDTKSVRLDHRQHARDDAVCFGRRRQFRGKPRIDFDRGDGVPLFQESEGQRPEPRADLDHRFARGEFRSGDNLANGVRIVNEVLSPLLGRRHLEPLGERANLGRTEERHHVP